MRQSFLCLVNRSYIRHQMETIRFAEFAHTLNAENACFRRGDWDKESGELSDTKLKDGRIC